MMSSDTKFMLIKWVPPFAFLILYVLSSVNWLWCIPIAIFGTVWMYLAEKNKRKIKGMKIHE